MDNILLEKIEAAEAAITIQKHTMECWGIDVYFYPTKPSETALIRKIVTDSDPLIYWSVETVLLKALNENGVRIYSNACREKLRNTNFQAEVNELAVKMQAKVTVEEAEKN